MAGSRKLELLAYQIKEEGTISFYEYDFPKVWTAVFKDFYRKLLGRNEVNLPVNSLNAALQALPSSLFETNTVDKPEKVWLKSIKAIKKELLLEIIQAWIVVEFFGHEKMTDVLKTEIINFMKEMNKESIKERIGTLDLENKAQHPNGTANPDGSIYSVLPAYVATQIAENQLPIEINGQTYQFMKSNTRLNGHAAVELISYPPEKSGDSYYSVGISFKVKTMPTLAEPMVLLDCKVKRWANGKYAETLARDHKTTVYMKYNTQGNKVDSGSTFGVEMLSYDRAKENFQWIERTKEILEYLQMDYLPETRELLADSEVYLSEKNPYTLLVMHNQYNRKDHDVKFGLHMEEKADIFKSIYEQVDYLQPMNCSQFKMIRKSIAKTNIVGYTNKKIPLYLEKLAESTQHMTLEILYRDERTRNNLLQVLGEELNQEITEEAIEAEQFTLTHEGLTLSVVCKQSGTLTSPLETYKKRVEEVKAFVDPKVTNAMTIVEILEAKAYKPSIKDPKLAIRRGLYESGRLNQFVTLDKKIKKDKLKNTILELFRQKGILLNRVQVERLKSIPKQVNLIGFSLLATNKSKGKDDLLIPVAINVNTECDDVLAMTPFGEWEPYDQAILRLGSMDVETKQKKQDAQAINSFLQSVLYSVQDEEVVLFIDVSNKLNTFMKELQDKNLQINECFAEFPRVRVIRIKSNEDIPDYLGTKEAEKATFISGVTQIKENVFYCVPKKSRTYPSRTYKPKLEEQDLHIKYPEIMEIVTAKLLEGDNPEEYAYLAYKMMEMNLTYGDVTKVPFVNHLGKQLEEVLEVRAQGL